jgi:hypothetical protein
MRQNTESIFTDGFDADNHRYMFESYILAVMNFLVFHRYGKEPRFRFTILPIRHFDLVEIQGNLGLAMASRSGQGGKSRPSDPQTRLRAYDGFFPTAKEKPVTTVHNNRVIPD